MNADQILSAHGADLLGSEPDEIRRAFRKLIAKWHPDVCADPQASAVVAKLTSLRDSLLSGGPAISDDRRIIFTRRNGERFAMKWLAKRAVETGTLYTSRQSFSQHWTADYADLAEREIAAIRALRFADDRMKAQMAPFLPDLYQSPSLGDGSALTSIRRPGPEEVCLADLLAAHGPMPAKHAAWMCSGLLNIACYLEWAGLCHGAIATDMILIDPSIHSVRLAFGWCFSGRIGERPDILPEATLDIIPELARPGVKLRHRHDLQLIRSTVCTAMGNPSGSLLRDMGVPGAVVNWLLLPPAANPREDYAAWGKAMEQGWGPRRFEIYDRPVQDIFL